MTTFTTRVISNENGVIIMEAKVCSEIDFKFLGMLNDDNWILVKEQEEDEHIFFIYHKRMESNN